MILYANAEGKIINAVQERVFQGAAGSHRLILVSPFALSDVITATFTRFGGKPCAPVFLTAEHTLSGITDAEGNSLAVRGALIPSEILAGYGRVKLQFYVRYNGEAGEEIFSFEPYVFTVERGVRENLPVSPDDNVYERLLSAMSSLNADVLNGEYGARSLFAWKENAVYGKGELVFYTNEAGESIILRSAVDGNEALPYLQGALNGAYWENVLDFSSLSKEYLAQATQIKENAAAYASEAKTSAALAENYAEKLALFASMRVEAVENLPEYGSEGVLYLLVGSGAQGLFGVYTYSYGEWHKKGEINLNLAGTRALSYTLSASGWVNKRQSFSTEGLDAAEISVYPDDTAADVYLACGISAYAENGDIVFAAEKIPETDIGVTLIAAPVTDQVYAGYYTKAETDAALENTAKIFEGSITVPVSAWQNNTALLGGETSPLLARVTPSATVSVTPAEGYAALFLSHNIRAEQLGDGTITFVADGTPAADAVAEISVRI